MAAKFVMTDLLKLKHTVTGISINRILKRNVTTWATSTPHRRTTTGTSTVVYSELNLKSKCTYFFLILLILQL